MLRVTTPRMDAVVKQALARLRVKDDWPSRIDRIFVEQECLETLGTFWVDGTYPRVLFADPANFLFAMEYAPTGSVVWKAELLAGRIDPAVAGQVGRLLGTMHACVRAMTRRLPRRFADQEVFDQLRLDPYYRTTAARHPEVARRLPRS